MGAVGVAALEEMGCGGVVLDKVLDEEGVRWVSPGYGELKCSLMGWLDGGRRQGGMGVDGSVEQEYGRG